MATRDIELASPPPHALRSREGDPTMKLGSARGRKLHAHGQRRPRKEWIVTNPRCNGPTQSRLLRTLLGAFAATIDETGCRDGGRLRDSERNGRHESHCEQRSTRTRRGDALHPVGTIVQFRRKRRHESGFSRYEEDGATYFGRRVDVEGSTKRRPLGSRFVAIGPHHAFVRAIARSGRDT